MNQKSITSSTNLRMRKKNIKKSKKSIKRVAKKAPKGKKDLLMSRGTTKNS